MNKIKLIYDVLKTMKEKESFKGTVKVQGTKDQEKIIKFDNSFERNHQTGQTKAKISSEINHDGKKMKMDNNIEFEMPAGQGGASFFGHHHGFNHHKMMNLHKFINQHGDMENGRGHQHFAGVKEGLNKLTTFFALLDSLKLEEAADGSLVLSLEWADLPEDVKNTIKERKAAGFGHHHDFPAEHGRNCDREFSDKEAIGREFTARGFHDMEVEDLNLKININQNKEIEKITLQVTGLQPAKDETEENHDLNFTADIELNW